MVSDRTSQPATCEREIDMARRSKLAIAAVAAALCATMGATSVSAAPVGAGVHHVKRWATGNEGLCC